jgi:hypothetical protein
MPSLREELETACAKVRRQLEVENLSWSYKAVDDTDRKAALVAELQAELTELEDALANLHGRNPNAPQHTPP